MNFLLFPGTLHSLIQSPSSSFILFHLDSTFRESELSYAKKKERITRQSTKIKNREDKRKKECFIINILFKLRCYCCQNCNFHNEFQVRSQGCWKLPFLMTIFVERFLMKNLFRFRPSLCWFLRGYLSVFSQLPCWIIHVQARCVIKVNVFKSAITIRRLFSPHFFDITINFNIFHQVVKDY